MGVARCVVHVRAYACVWFVVGAKECQDVFHELRLSLQACSCTGRALFVLVQMQAH